MNYTRIHEPLINRFPAVSDGNASRSFLLQKHMLNRSFVRVVVVCEVR
jgi:hypothetical protein